MEQIQALIELSDLAIPTNSRAFHMCKVCGKLYKQERRLHEHINEKHPKEVGERMDEIILRDREEKNQDEDFS